MGPADTTRQLPAGPAGIGGVKHAALKFQKPDDYARPFGISVGNDDTLPKRLALPAITWALLGLTRGRGENVQPPPPGLATKRLVSPDSLPTNARRVPNQPLSSRWRGVHLDDVLRV